jgi:hypothetical protein
MRVNDGAEIAPVEIEPGGKDLHVEPLIHAFDDSLEGG